MDNQTKPLISVVTVCYNAVNELEKTMLSVLNQAYDNIEYIVIDGGSKESLPRTFAVGSKNTFEVPNLRRG